MKYLLGALFVLIAGAIIAILLASSGIINVSALERSGALDGVLGYVSRRSIAHHALARTNPFANDAAALASGLEHYRANCLDCHGASNLGRSEFAKGLKVSQLTGGTPVLIHPELRRPMAGRVKRGAKRLPDEDHRDCWKRGSNEAFGSRMRMSCAPHTAGSTRQLGSPSAAQPAESALIVLDGRRERRPLRVGGRTPMANADAESAACCERVPPAPRSARPDSKGFRSPTYGKRTARRVSDYSARGINGLGLVPPFRPGKTTQKSRVGTRLSPPDRVPTIALRSTQLPAVSSWRELRLSLSQCT
jgi:hypothetical protein